MFTTDNLTTLQSHILVEEQLHPGATGDFSWILSAVALAGKTILALSGGLLKPGLSVPALGAWECLIGLGLLNAHRHQSLNLRGAWLHLVGDALGSVGALLAGAAIWAFGWLWADPAVSLLIACLILASAWNLLRDATDVLMDAAPRHLDLESVRGAVEAEAMVEAVHDLHVWTIGQGAVALSCHVVTADSAEPARVLADVRRVLASRFGIEHSTVQVEPAAFAEAEDCSTDCGPDVATG